MNLTFEEALALTEPKIIAWKADEEDDPRVASVFSISQGAKQLAYSRFPAKEMKETTRRFQEAGHHVGRYSLESGVVWLAVDDRFTIWDKNAELATATRDTIATPKGTIARSAVREVAPFVSDDRAYRGVKINHDGGELVIVEVFKHAALISPNYDSFELLSDSVWIYVLGGALARWLGCPYKAGT